jgi:vancomycin permeability regulator SanA
MRPFTGQADVAIVLGNTVNEDGSLSPWLQGRVEAALNLYRKKEVRKLFVSGGITPGRTPEGDAMKAYLVHKGVPEEDIIADNYGQNTYLTARHFMELNSREKFRSAVVVTSFYHILRSKYIIQKLGYQNVAGDYSRAFFSWKDWYSMVRDCVGFYKYWLVY